ncbi:MAG: phosphate/phosphite/phosphonate ABC transporter substrate-binding protein [Cyanobacteria bacterium CAN_BIN43]|nr:phosphate/phosphite/phosphonate ABC transporter substrate-binding protein [Cyanobacteria bacterium CAN_BIN43]
MNGKRILISSLIVLIGAITIGCGSQETVPPEKLSIGVVSYGEGASSIDKFQRLKEYLEKETNSMVELEPAYNELQAIEQIQGQRWDLVFAPPGLVAIALNQDRYIPLFPLATLSSTGRALLVVRAESPIQSLNDLSNKVIALGEKGSAAGYYIPLYDLYGLTLSEVRFASVPRQILEWLSQGTVDAGALSEADFEQYRKEFSSTNFRILHTSRLIPSGAVLLGPNVDRNRQELIRQAMSKAPADITADTGYLPTNPPIDYKTFVELVGKVSPLEERVRQKPAVLTMEQSTPETATDEATPVAAPTASSP